MPLQSPTWPHLAPALPRPPPCRPRNLSRGSALRRPHLSQQWTRRPSRLPRFLAASLLQGLHQPVTTDFATETWIPGVAVRAWAAPAPPGGWRGNSWPLSASESHLSQACACPYPSAASSSPGFLSPCCPLLCPSCLPPPRTLVTTYGPPGAPRLLPPPLNPSLGHICKSLLSRLVTFPESKDSLRVPAPSFHALQPIWSGSAPILCHG